jgi:methylglutaconyl-CoA hydratase
LDSTTFTVGTDSRGVVELTFNRPKLHNAFNDLMIKELTHWFAEAESDDSIRLVVLTGNGRSFCAGADLNWMRSMKEYSAEENIQDSMRLDGMYQAINNFTRPVIGKMGGAAIGGGVGLIAVCDHVVAVEGAKIQLSEVRLGLVPAVISPYVIAKIGESYARSTFISGQPFNSKHALQIGLVHQVVPQEELDSTVEMVVERCLKAAPLAQRACKELIKNVVEHAGDGHEEISRYTCHAIANARVSDEGQEGMDALLSKRPPSWLESKE